MQSPGGSSTGVAVGVSAGFIPLGIGTETDGSLNTPASRAALSALKVSVGSSSSQGVISISSTFDSLGGMGKTVKDVALLTDALLNEDVRAGFPGGLVEFLTDSWKDIRVGVVDASLWQLPPHLLVSDDEYKEQMVTVDLSPSLKLPHGYQIQKSALDGTAAEIKKQGAYVVHPLHLLPASSLKVDDEPVMPIIMSAACHHAVYTIIF